MKFGIAGKGIILVAVPLLFEIAFVGLLVFSLQQTEAKTERQLLSQSIVEKSTILLRKMVSLGIYTVVFQSRGENNIELGKGEQSLGGTLKELDKLVGNDEILKPSYKEVKRAARKFHTMLSRFSNQDLGSLMSKLSSTNMFGDVSDNLRNLNHSVRAFSRIASSKQFLQMDSNNPLSGVNLRTILITGVLLNLAVTIFLARNFVKSISSRLSKLAENTRRVAQGLAPKPLLGGNDELSSLDLVIHRLSQQLQAAEKQSKQLSAMLKGKLQQPLAEAVNCFTLLQESTKSELNDSGRDWIKTSSKNLKRLIALLNDLLQMDNIRAGFVELNKSDIESTDLISQSLESVQSLVNKKGIKIVLKGALLSFNADADRLTQVLVNFLSNAIKFSPKQSTITIITSEYENDYVEFRVKDEGPGIDREAQAKIFERYEQTERSDATKHGGAGLGLNICSVIVRSHRGQIGVDSEAGKGSEFWIRVPKSERALPLPAGTQIRTSGTIAATSGSLTLTGASASPQSHEAEPEMGNVFLSLKIWHKGLIVVAVPLLFQTVFLVLLYTMVARAEAETARELHAMQITGAANALFREAVTMGTTAGGVFLRQSDDRDFYSYGVTLEYLLERCTDLFELERQDPSALPKVSAVYHNSEKICMSTGKLMLSQPPTSSLLELASFQRRVSSIQNSLDSLARSISRLLEKQQLIEKRSPALRAQARAEITGLIIEALVVSILLSVLLGAFFSTSISKRVKVLIEDTLRFTEAKPLLPMLQGSDELSLFHADFKQMVRRLEENQDFKQHMLAVVSHELRTPLTSVFGALTMIQQGVYGQVSQENNALVQSAYDNILQVILLVNDLLDLERIEAGKFPLEFQKLDAIHAVESAIASAKESRPELKFKIKADFEEMPDITADPVLCTRALSRLMLFCKQGSHALDVQEETPIDLSLIDGRFVLRIPFNGNVLKNIDSKNLFEKFQLLEHAEGSDLKGSALSLALSKTIVTQMLGEIKFVQNDNEAESYFEIDLPLAKEVSAVIAV